MERAPRRLAAALAAATVLAACGGGADDPDVVTADVPATVALGVLPEPLTDQPTLPPLAAPATTPPPTTQAPPQAVDGLVGEAVDGDLVLLIGDSMLASAAPPADIRVCDALTLFGWDVEMDTTLEGTDLTFVADVLDARLAPTGDAGDDEESDAVDWDVVGLFVGSQLPADELAVGEFTEVLDEVIERVSPRPLLLYTLTETDAIRRRLNEVVRERAAQHDNVVLIDWAELGGPASEVIRADGIGLGDDGLKRFALYTAQQMGQAPADQDGTCRDPRFGPEVEED